MQKSKSLVNLFLLMEYMGAMLFPVWIFVARMESMIIVTVKKDLSLLVVYLYEEIA